MVDKQSDLKLKDTPEDGISSIKFRPASSQYLLASSWDGSVRLFDVIGNSLKTKYTHPAPVLDICFQDAVHFFSGGLDNTLKLYDLNSSSENVLGTHEGAIRCLDYCSDTNSVVSGSWDTTIKVWDSRTSQCVGTYPQPSKVYAMSICGSTLVVGTAGRKVMVWDLRQMSYVQQRRESSLKYQTRCIRTFPNKQGYVLSSIEGRVAVEYFDTSAEIQKKKYAFKCHRVKESGTELIYPVNAISFHNSYNTFATGGSDGFVSIWDGFNKKRLCQFRQYPTSIASLSFSHDGSVLAIASSYMYEMETHPEPLPEDAIFIRTVTDQETKPK